MLATFYDQPSNCNIHICDGGTIEAFEIGRDHTLGQKERRWKFTFHSSDHELRGREFSGVNAVASALNGEWDEGMKLFDDMELAIQAEKMPSPISRRRRGTWNEDDGDDLSFDRYRTGQAPWRTSKRRIGTGPNNVTICVDIGGNCNVNHEDLVWRGVAAVTMAKLLEKAGYRAEIWACDAGTRAYTNDRGVFQAVRLKRHNDRLDVASLVNGISGWYFRTVFFSMFNIADCVPECGLGRHASIRKNLHYIAGASAVVIEDCWNKKTAMECIKKQMVVAVGEANLVEA